MARTAKFAMDQLKELLLQALETERGGIKLYTVAIEAARNPTLKQEWTEYLEETRTHEEVLTRVFETLALDTEEKSPGRTIVAHQGAALVKAVEAAMREGRPEAAELVAAECVVLAETKDHLNWELIGHVAKHAVSDVSKTLQAAHAAVETDEDHHLYHTKGWCRELWIQSLGFPAVLPPPEEVKQVETAIGASRAEQARDSMLGRRH
jgi:rubrerythrin